MKRMPRDGHRYWRWEPVSSNRASKRDRNQRPTHYTLLGKHSRFFGRDGCGSNPCLAFQTSIISSLETSIVLKRWYPPICWAEISAVRNYLIECLPPSTRQRYRHYDGYGVMRLRRFVILQECGWQLSALHWPLAPTSVYCPSREGLQANL